MHKAINSFEEALQAYSTILPTGHPLVLALCNELGDLYFEQSAYDHAYLCQHMFGVLVQRVLGQFHPCNAMLFCKLAVLLHKRGSFKQALSFAKASFVLYEEMMLAGLSIEMEVHLMGTVQSHSCILHAHVAAIYTASRKLPGVC